MNQVTADRHGDSRWSWLFRISGGAALISGLVLGMGLISLMGAVQTGTASGWLSSFQSLWLIVILKLHAGFGGVQLDQLTGLNLLDLVFLALVGVMHLGLYAALRRTSRVWSIVAAIQPWLGMVLLLATNTAGRSTVMGAALVASVLMLRSALFKRTTAYIGLLASVLLLIGDFSAGVISPSPLVATLFGIGYVLLATWFFLIADALIRPGSGTPSLQS